MRVALWTDEDADELAAEAAGFLRGELEEPQAVLVAQDDERIVGMVELSIRRYAEGCRSDRVAYVEAWYVEEEARREGVGRALIRAAEDWGRAQGCVEMGSDGAIWNEGSIAAHMALGFEEVERIVCFRKEL